jgi:ABC-2 type transport system permease protein
LKSMLRRDGFLFLKDLLPTLVITIIMALISTGSMLAVLHGSQSLYTPVSVALVDEEDSLLSRFAINLVSRQSYISSLLSIEKTEFDQAMEGLYNGSYAAIVRLPENYIENIVHGQQSSGTIMLSDALSSNSEVVEAVANLGQLLLAAGQYGVFSGERLVVEYGLPPEYHSRFLKVVNERLLAGASNSFEDYFEVVTVPYSGTSLSVNAYYACVWLTYVLFLCGLFFHNLCTKDSTPSMYGRLLAAGIRPSVFVFGKILYPFLFRILLFSGVLAVLSQFINLHLGAAAIFSAVLAAILITTCTSCLMAGLAGNGGAQTTILVVSTAGLFLSGGLIPLSMLPDWLSSIGRLLPLGAAMSFIAPLFGGLVKSASVFISFGYAVLSIVLCSRFLKTLPARGGES